MIIFIYALVLIVYFKCPKYLKLIILVANLFLPDVVPILDEAIMLAGFIATK